MSQRDAEFFERNFTHFSNVFDPRIYKRSTLIRKRCHLSLYVRFSKGRFHGERSEFCCNTYLRTSTPTDILMQLKEWAVQLALAGLSMQLKDQARSIKVTSYSALQTWS